jgi:NAD(P)-dependent dehydrogenase (short-subunit alcohol dehydrogenase family)
LAHLISTSENQFHVNKARYLQSFLEAFDSKGGDEACHVVTLLSHWPKPCRERYSRKLLFAGTSVDAVETSDKPAEEVAEFGADTPMQRPAQPEEIAPAFVYFASEVDSSYVTGEVLTLLGGETTAG